MFKTCKAALRRPIKSGVSLSIPLLLCLLFVECHGTLDAEEPKELFMWGGEMGEEHVVSWRNTSGHTREISLTVLSSQQPKALHVKDIFDPAECDLLIHLAKQAGLFDSEVQSQGPNMWSEEFIKVSFDNMDINQDGQLDELEFQGGLSAAPEDTQQILAFAKPDKNEDGFVTLDEALHMDIQAAHLQLEQGRTGLSRLSKVRNSRQTWLARDSPWYNEAIVEFIDSVFVRMAAALQLPVDYVRKESEALQVIHYQQHEHYYAHMDTRENFIRANQDPSWLIDSSEDLAMLDAIVFEAEDMFSCCHQMQERHAYVRQALNKVFKPQEIRQLPALIDSQQCSSTSRCSMLRNMKDYLTAVTEPHLLETVDAFECSTCRYATLLVFLNDVTEGGHTTFPYAFNSTLHENPSLIPRESHRYTNLTATKCKPGLSVKPQKGHAVLWYNYKHFSSKKSKVLPGSFGVPDALDEFSLHGGCDVLQGEKWAINLWLHATPKRRESQYGLDRDTPPE